MPMTFPTERDTQPYKFELILADGSKITGGAESKALCIDHITHCLYDQRSNTNRVVTGFYLGRKSSPVRREIKVKGIHNEQ